jgi:oligopeptidase A
MLAAGNNRPGVEFAPVFTMRTAKLMTISADLPRFSAIDVAAIEPSLRVLIDENRAALQQLLDSGADRWDTLVVPLEERQHQLNRRWSPVGHLNGVANNDALRQAYNACLPLLTAWNTEVSQNNLLYQAYSRLRERDASQLSAAQRKLLDNALRDFRLGGVALTAERKQQFAQVLEQLVSAQAKFDENVLDATNAWSHHTTDATQIAGLPDSIVARARAAAADKQLEGWLFALDPPNYQAILSHADDATLRRAFYEAWSTRASDQGPLAGQWDNTALIQQILALRHELATLLDFPNYTEYSLATKMANSAADVFEFLHDLGEASKTASHREFDELQTFAGRTLNAWDVGYFAERLKRERFAISEEELRPYFPLPRVLEGLFGVAARLYGIRIVERNDVDLYHPDVRYFDILDADGTRRAGFYIDLYARARKRGGAWMDECVGRKRLGATSSEPVAYLVCNFMAPVAGKPALLTHSEVVTLFHEFGHGLHHMLTRVDYPSIAGINGVPWDAVELPSQFMENFAWQPEVLPLISAHVDTGAALPREKLEKLLGSRTFQAGMANVRQLEFALFDLRIHAEYQPGKQTPILQTLQQVRAAVAVIQAPAFNRFPNSFQHIFSGGYASGYYSYKWAEVLAADAFDAFATAGVFDATIAKRFLKSILEQGGSRDAMEAFVEFRGRKPEVGALLRQLGLAA